MLSQFKQETTVWISVVLGFIAVWLWANIIHRHTNQPPAAIAFTDHQVRTTLRLETDSWMAKLNSSSGALSSESITQASHLLEAAKLGFSATWKIAPVKLEHHHETRVWLALVRGGHPVSRLSPRRMGVTDFVSRSGAVAGINGGFFVDASLEGTNNFMIGPVMTEAGSTEVSAVFQPERNREILERVQSRPLVIWGDQRIAVLPFDADAMNSPELLRAFMPDLKNVFLGGAWILRHGQAVTESELEQSGPRDANDVRPRVFFGMTNTSQLALGASMTPTSSSNLARAALAAGVREAVLLDSGYSTSLVFDSRIIAVGRKTAKVPSRPVPHAIVVMGAKESTLAQRASSQTGH
jgi:poly-beta-1,6-N-acetyl-D-glucosamine N-deacetylase